MRTIADKQISDLVAATSVQPADLFVLEQSSTAKKLTGQILINWLTAYADGHGGIQSITWQTSGTSGNGQLHTATIHYADETTSTFSIRDGYKGDQGDSWYFWIRYAADLPTSDADMTDTPDNYIGVYYGTSATAPSTYSAYDWYQWKGDKGNTGDAARIVSQSVGYMASSSGTVVPEGSWQSSVPVVAPGNYLWTRTRLVYNDETEVTSYSVGFMGVNGSGAVSTVNSVSPDGNGNVAVTATNIPTNDARSVQEHITDIESNVTDLNTYRVRHVSAQLSTLPTTFSYSWLTADHRIVNVEFGDSSVITSAVTWTTSAGELVLSGTIDGVTTIEFDIVKEV